MKEVRSSSLSDSIDAHLQQILAGYRSAVPSIDAGPIQLFGRLGALSRLYDLFTERFLVGVTHREYQALGLIRAGIASSSAELAFYLRWETEEAAAVLEQLTRAELIGSAPTEEGGEPQLSLTDKGVQVADESLRAISKAQTQVLDGLEEPELKQLQDALDELIGRLSFLYPG